MTTTVDLLAAGCAHLAEFELPAIASVHVSAALSAPQVTVQLACHELSAIAQGLLAWADTLTQVTAQTWPDGRQRGREQERGRRRRRGWGVGPGGVIAR